MSSFAQRMKVIVGDQNTVYRYLLEKIGHTGAIAWMLAASFAGWQIGSWTTRVFVFHVALVCAIAASLSYDLIGKVLWLAEAHVRAGHYQDEAQGAIATLFLDESLQPVQFWTEVRDTLFDLWVGSFSAFCAVLILDWRLGALAIAVWFIGLDIGSANQWGRPS